MEDGIPAYNALTPVPESEVRKALALLPYAHREVLNMLEGLGDGFCYPCEVVARIFDRPEAEIREIEMQARKRLDPVFLQRIEDRGVRRGE